MANRAPDFFRQLNEQLLEQLEEYARQPGRQGEEVQAWLADRKVSASRSAVYRWLQDFRLEDNTRRAAAMTRSFIAAVKDADGMQVMDAAILQTGQMIFELGSRVADGGDVTVSDVGGLSLALQRLMLAKAREEKTRTEMEKRQQKAIEEASKVADCGGDGRSVVDKVREILGVK
jgi:hypothetical protein